MDKEQRQKKLEYILAHIDEDITNEEDLNPEDFADIVESLLKIISDNRQTLDESVQKLENLIGDVKTFSEDNDVLSKFEIEQLSKNFSNIKKELLDAIKKSKEEVLAQIPEAQVLPEVKMPIKGVDYFTEDDKNEIASLALSQHPFRNDKDIQKAIDLEGLKKEIQDKLQKEIQSIKNILANNSMPVTTSFVNGIRAKNLNFVGATVTYNGDTANITITSGGGSGTVTSVASADGSITVTNPTTTPDLSVVSAPKLTTARTIGGVSFDGSANIVPQTIQSVNEATDTTCFPLFISASGSQSLQPLNNVGFTYNSNTNALTVTTFIGALTGNASTATALQNARTIGGVSFDGTAAITVASATGGFTISGGNLVIDARNISTDTTTGTKFGTATNQKIGFFNSTPIVQPTGDVITALQNLGLGASLTVLATTITSRTLWGQTYDGSGNVSGSLTAVTDITGGASNMVITAGTGNSRTLTLRSTTSGGVATAFITGNADQSITFGGTAVLGANSITMTGSIAATGARVTKGWLTDIESTNMPTVGGTAILTSLTAPQFTTIELGAASDTTLARVSAGVISVEGVTLLTTATGLQLSGGTMTGSITLGENAGLALDPAGSADGKWTGITMTGTGGANIAFGDLVYLDAATSRWKLTDADASATAGPVDIAMAITSSTDGGALTVLRLGNIRADAKFPTLTVGAPVYVGETAGTIQVAIPTGADNIIRIVGFAITTDEIYFNPSQDHQVTVA